MPRKKRGRRKTYPVVKTLDFNINSTDARYIDIAQCLSLVNRRMYRQKMLYFIEAIEYIPDIGAQGAETQEMFISKIPNSWTCENAIQKGFAFWTRQNRSDSHGSNDLPKPKYHDFKVFFDPNHYQNGNEYGSSVNLVPVDGGQSAYSTTNAEWVHSIAALANDGGSGTPSHSEYGLHVLGADSSTDNGTLGTTGSWSLSLQYGMSRTTVSDDGDPHVPGDASESLFHTWFDDGDTMQAVINNLENDNDEPPYAMANNEETGDDPLYPGSGSNADAGQLVAKLTSTPSTTHMIVPGGEIPCGLLKVHGVENADGLLRIHLAAGTYKGVAAVPLGS